MKINKKEEKNLSPYEAFKSHDKEDDKLKTLFSDTKKLSEKISNKSLFAKAMFLLALLLILLMLVAYIISLFYTSSGSLTIKTISDVSDGRAISVSETSGFANPTVMLKGTSNDHLDNITYDWLNLKEITSKDGANNGENYLAYNFYVKNTGSKNENYTYNLIYTYQSRSVDEAVRIMLIKNGEQKIYAKSSSYTKIETFPSGVVNFADENNHVIATDRINNFEVNQIDKYTIVVWLEGEDPECVDAVKGGAMKIEMNFNVVD